MSMDRIGYIEKLLQKRQIRLSLNNNQLKYEAPKGALTSTIKVLLKNNEEDLKERLRSRLQPSVIFDPAAIGSNVLVNGDCLAILKQIPDNSIDCMVTDPPYGLNFMSKNWDRRVPPVAIWKECLRVLKPGAFAYILCSPRQDLLNRMFHNLEEAGFDTRFTSIYWTYASGFAKATNVKKQLKKRTDKPGMAEQFEGTYAGFQPKPAVR